MIVVTNQTLERNPGCHNPWELRSVFTVSKCFTPLAIYFPWKGIDWIVVMNVKQCTNHLKTFFDIQWPID